VSKLIIQHRRGTTTEWRDASSSINDKLPIIPAEGELLVEECEVCSKTDECLAAYEAHHANGYDPAYTHCEVCGKHLDYAAGDTKIKIGNGVKTFNELQYVTTDVEERIRVLNERLNELIAPTDSELTLDAELLDIRISYDGIPYLTAGDAVRAIGNEVSDLRKSLSQFIDADAVDGLYYENNILYLTANDQILEDTGVEIVSGTGGGTASDVKVRLTNLSPQGTNFSTISTDTVTVNFKFTSLEDDIPTGDFTCVIQVNGVKKKTIYCKQKDEGEIVDLTSFLVADANTVKITCTDVFGNSRSIVYNIEVVELTVRSSFNSSIVYDNESYNNGIDIRYAVVGLVEKTVYFELDGKILSSRTLAASTSGKELSEVISWNTLSHGSHSLKIYAEAVIENATLKSNILHYDVLAYVKGETAPMIGSVYDVDTLSQGELVTIPYVVFDPNDAVCNVNLVITYCDNGVTKEYSRTTASVDQTLQTWNTRLYPVNDSVTFSIIYAPDDLDTPIIKSHTVKVTEAIIDVEPVGDPRLYLSSLGRNNNETNPASWTFYDEKYKSLITTTFSGFNWKSNGWVIDNNGDTCLRLSGGAQAVINFAPFHYTNSDSNYTGHTFNILNNGLTFEIEFAVHDVNNRDTTVLNCYLDGKGIQATADTAFIKSSKDTITCNYKDEERIKLTFTIDKDGTDAFGNDTPKFLSVYMDGYLSGVLSYTSNDFNHDGYIILGDTGCTLDVYSIRVYDQTITPREAVSNYIADLTDVQQKIELFDDNDIYTLAGLLSYESVKSKIPTITFTGSMPKSKGDKKIVTMDFSSPYDSSKDFANVYGGPIQVEIDVQGTSSQYYVRKNWKVKLKKKKDNVIVFDHAAYQHMDNEIPAKVFCIKVDYAEGTGTHNTQNANFVETLYSEIVPAQADDDRVRTTITGFPCVIYERETENDTPVFSSKGNFNFDKDAEEAFGFTEDYDVECWEFCNNTSDSCNFLGNFEASSYWLDDFEPRYTPYDFDKLEELEDLKKSADKGEATITDEQLADLSNRRAQMINNFKELHDWVVSTRNDVEKFKREFEDYFDMHYSLIYYVYTFVALMTDQRAKNMFLTRWGTKDENGNTVSKWYPYFYDNDTSYGINNEGYLVFDYYHEDTDQLGNVNVYNGQNSTLWTNFRKAFATEIRAMYASLRSDGKLSYDKIINQFITHGSGMWSASIYNEDAEYKYLTMARPENSSDGSVNTANLYQVRGNGEPHLKYFVQNRLKYCDSKWNAGDYPNDYVLMRINTPSEKIFPSDVKFESVTLAANESYTFCVTGTPTSTTTINYTNDNESGTIDAYINGDGFSVIKFFANYNGLYTFTTSNDYQIVEAGGSYPEGASDEEKAEIDRKNACIRKSLEVVPADPKITVTPFSDMYCGVKYKANGTLEQLRTKKNTPQTFGKTINETFNDTETAVFGASELSSLGNLAGLYCSILDTSAAGKLTVLQVGDKTDGYYNDALREVKVGANTLLKKIDLSNCIGLEQSVDLTRCVNIEEIYCLGTSISGITLPTAGYIKNLELPATITDFTITNHPNLYTENLKIGKTGLEVEHIKNLCIINCTNLDTSAIFEKCLETNTLERVRIDNVYWTEWSSDELRQLYTSKEDGGYGLKGLDVNNQPINEINISGTCILSEDMSGEDMAELVRHFPYLTFQMANGFVVTSIITFMNNEGTEVLHTETIEATTTINVTCPDPVIIDLIETPKRQSSVAYDYTWNGWSIQRSQDRVAQDDALKNILGNKTLFPAFIANIRSYTGAFYTGSNLLYDELIEYSQSIIFDASKVTDQSLLIDDGLGKLVPKNMASSSPDSYEFAGWLPADMKILGNTKFHAQFYIGDDAYYNIMLNDLIYASNADTQTISVLAYKNTNEPIARFPQYYTLEDGLTYQVDSIYGNDSTNENVTGFKNSLIEYIELPESLTIIGRETFSGCSSLTTVHIPSNVSLIEANAISKCPNLSYVYYNARNAVARNDSSLLGNTYPFSDSSTTSGMKVVIGPDVERINSFTFYQATLTPNMSYIYELDLTNANKCETIGSSAFNLCNLKSLKFNQHGALKSISNSAFANNYFIQELSLPDGIESIGIGSFESWNQLEKLSIPSSLTSMDGAFRYCEKLRTFNIAENSIFEFSNGALIDTTNRKLVFGTSDAIITNDISTVAAYAFAGCEDLTSMYVPANVTHLSTETFSGCTSLANITFEDGITTIGSQCFYRCQSLHEINLPNTLQRIETNAFGESVIKKLVIPASVTYLGLNICLGCKELEEVTILNPNPSADFMLVTIDGVRKLFEGCTKLTKINVAWSEDVILGSEETFWGAPNDNVVINYNYTEVE